LRNRPSLVGFGVAEARPEAPPEFDEGPVEGGDPSTGSGHRFAMVDAVSTTGSWGIVDGRRRIVKSLDQAAGFVLH